MNRTEAELAQALAVRAFADLLVDAMAVPELAASVERFASALLVATTAGTVQRAEVRPLAKL